MQYKMYSPSVMYLPVMPTVQFEAISNESIKAHLEDNFIFMGGKTAYLDHNNLAGSAADLTVSQLEQLQR